MTQQKGMLVNKQHFCELLGITKYQFERYVTAGMPVHKRPINKQDEYLVFAGDCIDWMLANVSTAPRTKAGEADSFEDARKHLAKEQAKNYALKNAQLESALLPAEDVVAGWQAAVGRCRAMFLGMASALAPRHVALAHIHTDNPQLHERLLREGMIKQIDAALAELSNTSVEDVEDEEDESDLPGEKPLRREGASAH